MKRRTWLVSRQTYFPPIWRIVSETLTIAVVVWALIGSGWIIPAGWVTVIASWTVQVVATSAWTVWRWRRWRREHPVVPPHEVLRRRREAAPWN